MYYMCDNVLNDIMRCSDCSLVHDFGPDKKDFYSFRQNLEQRTYRLCNIFETISFVDKQITVRWIFHVNTYFLTDEGSMNYFAVS